LISAARRVLNILSNLVGCPALLLDGGRNGPRGIRDFADRTQEALGGADGFRGRSLDSGNLRSNFLGRFCRLRGERFNLLSDDSEASARITSPSGFNSGV
jgi:hypothetical protein